jgi:hypothetical protein
MTAGWRRPTLLASGPVSVAVLLAACARPSADEVLDRMLAAMDAEGTRSTVQSLSTTAEGSGPEGLFVTTVTSIPPDSLYFRQVSGRGTTEIWSTPDNTWGGRAGEEYEPLGGEVRDFVRQHEFHFMLLDVRSRFSSFELQGEESVAGRECLRISMTSQESGDASLCVGTQEWLPLELRLNPPSGSGPIRIEFGDWKEVDGLKVFHSFELVEDAQEVYTYNFVDISVNRFATEIRVPPPTLPRVREGDG